MQFSRFRLGGYAFVLVIGAHISAASAQLRIVTWNVSNYSSGRINEFQTAIYGVFQGRTLAPDVIIGQEFLSQSGVNNFRNLLNGAAGSPGDWASAPFLNGPNTDNAFFYRTSKVTYLGVTTIAFGGPSPNHPRNVERYDIRPVGYSGSGTVLACYSSHMKAGSGGSDQSRRLVEAQRIRDDAESLPSTWHFLIGADFNIQSSGQAAYQEMVGNQANNNGRFFDPISTPGDWNNNSTYRIVHTQDPSGAGGMDDRHDQILLSESLIDGDGFDYVGNPAIPYSNSTWNDPNHSYRSWGNDGTSYNGMLRISGNTMVGSTIAQALVASATGGGHLPVVLDLRVPSKVNSATVVDFGQAAQSSTAEQTLTVTNSADVALWTAPGIADLNYSLSTSSGFTAPVGSFIEAPGGTGNDHVIAMDTSTPGPKNGTLTISSDAPDEPIRTVTLIGEVIVPCEAGDVNCDSQINISDVVTFVDLLIADGIPCSACAGDTSGDGELNGDDIRSFTALLVGA